MTDANAPPPVAGRPGILPRADGATIAYHATEGESPGVMFLGGFRSDMTGTKATALEAACRENGRAFLRFDYFGHGESSGDFTDGTIGRWRDDAIAVLDELTDGPIAPPTMLSVWFRPHHWSPGRTEPAVPLQAHFDLKDDLDLPEAIISSNTNTFHEPVRIGDEVRSRQILRSISDPKTTKLGRGRFWVIDVEYLNQDDVLLGVESYTAFGYRRPEGDGS